jgi:hypothetical protein
VVGRLIVDFVIGVEESYMLEVRRMGMGAWGNGEDK